MSSPPRSNLATNLLIDFLGTDVIRATVDRLGAHGLEVLRGVEDIKAYRAGKSNTTTARALLTMLEAIANGSAVDEEASREMTEILARQHFNEGIPAGLPEGVRVAHKTGQITRIHHDAAIVEGPRPFVLVVLVEGLDDDRESAVLIGDIARTVYASATTSETTPGSGP